MSKDQQRAEMFKAEVSGKVEKLLDEFANGDISREQFEMIYERYSRQLAIAEDALDKGKPEDIQKAMNQIPTLALRAAIKGKALGMAIIHHRNLEILRTFGMFELDDNTLKPILDKFSHHVLAQQLPMTDLLKLYGNTWLVSCSMQQSTTLTIFRNEPSVKQLEELERRHQDFETANRNLLKMPDVNPDLLAYPVQMFVTSAM